MICKLKKSSAKRNCSQRNFNVYNAHQDKDVILGLDL